MINRLRHFFLSQKLFSALSALFAGYLIVFLSQHFINNPALALLQTIGGLFFMILGTGISIVLVIQWPLKRNFDQWEFLSLAFLGGIIIAPSILTVEFILIHKVYDWYPLFNTAALWFGAGFLLFLKKTSLPSFFAARTARSVF